LPHNLLILGASCRAAAFSALRAGFQPRCADYFADRDLAAVCPVDSVDSHHPVQQIVTLAESLSRTPWFYTGGIENHPDCVERIARRHSLWGADADTLRAVRDPIRVFDALDRRGIPVPPVTLDHRKLPRDGSWLIKPLRSAGGRGVQLLTDRINHNALSCYFQRRVRGSSFSALFIGGKSGAVFVGVTRQLIGIAGFPFAYRGSIGPLLTTQDLNSKLLRLGNALALDFGLVGWFGVDYIVHGGDPWPVEVNPRYPASLEIHELATGRALLLEHRRVCDGTAHCAAVMSRPARRLPRVVGKLIVYAPRALVAPNFMCDDDHPADLFAVPAIADIPWPGTRFNRGDPVMTIMATGESPAECRSRLLQRERTWLGCPQAADGIKASELTDSSWARNGE
jgi:predicted ATP-grasp superfamily ATP-dependent carboligase